MGGGYARMTAIWTDDGSRERVDESYSMTPVMKVCWAWAVARE